MHILSPGLQPRHVAMRRWMWLAVIGLLIAGVPERSALAATVTICTEAGLDAALASGDTIDFDCGGPATIKITHTKQISASRTIHGGNLITLSGGDAVQIFAVDPNVTLTLNDLILSGGKSAGGFGGAIFNYGTLVLDHVTLRGNSAGFGGAIYNNGVAAITSSTFRANTATSNGGSITNSSIGSVTLAGSTIISGTAGVRGGGVYNQGALTFSNSTISGNRAVFGGGIDSPLGSLALTASTVSGNSANSAGGIDASGTLTVTNSTISGNSAAGDGGGLFARGTVKLNNTTIANNTADRDRNGSGNGGGIFNNPGSATTILNTLLADNSDTGAQAPDCAGALASQGNNLIKSLAGCIVGGNPAGNITGASPLLGPLASNGGPSQTQALLVGSPAIDSANTATCAQTDQRGVARPTDGDQNTSFICDIGAYELGFVVNSAGDAPDLNRDPVCDTSAAAGIQCTLRAAIQLANGLAGLDAITFAITTPITLTTVNLNNVTDDAAATGDLDITQDLIIAGQGANRTIVDGANNVGIDGVFHIVGTVNVAISGMTIRNASGGPNNYGGGVRNFGNLTLSNSVVSGNNITLGSGGGIANLGTLTLINSTVNGNTASGDGGGIFNDSGKTITLIGSTVSRNTSGGVLGGGGINNQGQATLINVTISGNSANWDGGGISTVTGVNADALTLNNVTITGNTADANIDGTGNGGGIYRPSNTLDAISLRNTIVAANTDRGGQAPDCSGVLTSQGFNLVGDTTGCTFKATASDQAGAGASRIAPLLGPLRNNGSTNQTHAPLTGSPAINRGNPGAADGDSTTCASTDERGVARPQGTTCDIGAHESFLADVQIGMVATPTPAPVGGKLSYTITVKNMGPSATAGVSVTDTLSQSLTLISATPSQGQCSGKRTVGCLIGTLPISGTAKIVIVVKPLAAIEVANTVNVTASEADPNTTNNRTVQKTLTRYMTYMPWAAKRSR